MGTLACGNDPPGADTDASTGDPPNTESSPSTNPSTSTTQPPGTATETTGEEDTTGGSVSTSLSDTGDPSTTNPDTTTTGTPGECVDEDIGMSIGKQVANGDTANAGDDFSLEFCSGGGGSSSGFPDTEGGFVSFVGSEVSFVGPGSEGGFVSEDDGGDTFGSSFVTGFTDTFPDSSSSGGSNTGDDYVIEWTPPESGAYTFSLAGSSFDTLLAISPPECGAETLVCNDDCFGLDSALVFEATEGETIYIIVTGYNGQVGNFVLSIYDGGGLECGGGDTDTATDGSFTESASTTDFSTTGVVFIVDPSTG